MICPFFWQFIWTNFFDQFFRSRIFSTKNFFHKEFFQLVWTNVWTNCLYEFFGWIFWTYFLTNFDESLTIESFRNGVPLILVWPRRQTRSFLNCFVSNTLSSTAKQLRNFLEKLDTKLVPQNVETLLVYHRDLVKKVSINSVSKPCLKL